jgi:hypothetical protein
MNERIRGLFNEATFGLETDLSKQRTVTLNEIEKFAELIVQECMWKIMNRKEEAIDNDWDVDEAMSAAISDISEHFGVEE